MSDGAMFLLATVAGVCVVVATFMWFALWDRPPGWIRDIDNARDQRRRIGRAVHRSEEPLDESQSRRPVRARRRSRR